ncbi:helix-turn-helix domain-containing protein [Nonomuraea sp. NPDC049152]|uniref:TetR/AcrR family transcriptional regulator n=1 Tax=Nonomuraea sp. NPDC049152 TaxID=3154350 RepID=UPI0033CD6E4C
MRNGSPTRPALDVAPDPPWSRDPHARCALSPRARSRRADPADAEGLDALSMRRVAAELGSGTTSLYRYIKNRDELLDLMWRAGVAPYIREVVAGGTYPHFARQVLEARHPSFAEQFAYGPRARPRRDRRGLSTGSPVPSSPPSHGRLTVLVISVITEITST